MSVSELDEATHQLEILHTHRGTAAVPPGVVGDSINAIRFLAVDAVERAKSGHPGTAMALAPLAYALYTRHLRHDPRHPSWPDRDRFVLSIGHASLLQYAALHLAGYDISINDLKAFRQWGSKAPGHPERGVTPGIEVTTGPLGQGFANAVGLAIAERMLAARFNRRGHEIVNHRTWAFAGDGDMMEGISSEAASLAGHLGIGKLTVFYDNNHITLEGPTSLAFSEDVAARFTAYNWHVTHIEEINDPAEVDRVVDEASAETRRPTLVMVHSHIGFGSPVQDSSAAHGAPLGAERAAIARHRLGWEHEPFEIPAEVYGHWRKLVARQAAAYDAWFEDLTRYRQAEPELANEFLRVLAGRLPSGWQDALPKFEVGKRLATRAAGGTVLNALGAVLPELVGGTADVSPSTLTYVKGSGDISADDWSGRNLHFGIREHAMGAIANGIAAHGGLRVFCSTFFMFSDYMRNTIRMAALMGLPVVFVFTHDSIGLGEDGPTHQPIEHLAGLRAMPGVAVIRPADAHETSQAWATALTRDAPTVLVLSRQGLPVLDPALVNVAGGGCVVAPGDDAAIVATGSEVEVGLQARDLLSADGIRARVVSMPSWELFRAAEEDRRQAILPSALPAVAVEAASRQGWGEFADDVVALDQFGASAPAEVLYRQLGITPEAVASAVRRLVKPAAELRR